MHSLLTFKKKIFFEQLKAFISFSLKQGGREEVDEF
jgi:hypothetical protein